MDKSFKTRCTKCNCFTCWKRGCSINKDIVLYATVPKGEVKSSVGAGDSMVAGFIAAYAKTKSIEEAFRFSVAAGSATAFSIGLCTREKMEELLPQVKVEKYKPRRGE